MSAFKRFMSVVKGMKFARTKHYFAPSDFDL
ncbi:MAG: hypothetical protein RL368_1527 [Pseudomonadota bacterium]|jgi:hypothetical protein